MSELSKEHEAELRRRAEIGVLLEPREVRIVFAALDAALKRIAEVERERDEERLAHSQIADMLLPVVGTPDGTTVGAVRLAVSRLADAEGVVGQMVTVLSRLPHKWDCESLQFRKPCTCGRDAALARAASWREGGNHAD